MKNRRKQNRIRKTLNIHSIERYWMKRANYWNKRAETLLNAELDAKQTIPIFEV